MKSLKKIFGALIILFFFGALFVFSVLEAGWLLAIAVWVGCAGIASLVWLAISWLMEE